jgi:hypothetical protein
MKLAHHALVLAIVGLATSAHAQQPAARNPDELFREGLALMGDEKFAEALAKLEAAEALDPGIGTQFNIGICYEKLGKLGTAYRNFASVQQLAHASGKTAREENARLRLEELRPRLSVVALTLTETATDTTLKVDDVVVPRSDWASYPIDPGTHKVDAVAPERRPWTAPFAAPAPGQRLEIKVPVLASSKQTNVVTVTRETTNGRRTLGFILGGVGVAGVVAATVTGILLLSDKATADRLCNPHCLNADGTLNQHGVDTVDQGKTLLPINAVAWGVAAAGLGAGAYLILTSTKKVSPMLGDHATGLMLSGSL